MSTAILTSYDRTDRPKKIRESGFIPAVVYGYGYEKGKPIQFKTSQVLSTIKTHGTNARVFVEIDGDKKYGGIKELQSDILTNKIKHLDIQLFKQDDVVKLTVPIYFTGVDSLIAKKLIVSTLINEIEITGKAAQIPQSITMNLEGKDFGDVVTVGDIELDEELKTSLEPTEALVTITAAKSETVTEDESADSEEVKAE